MTMDRKISINESVVSIRTASLVQVGAKVINIVVQLLITMVLARLLTPAEYGTVAVLTVFSTLFGILADAGISTAIARSSDLGREDYERLFFLSLLIGFVLSTAYFVLSMGIAWLYGDQVYVPLGTIMMLAVMFNSLNMVPNGILIKERKFMLIAFRLVVCTIVVGIITVLLALRGFGCYAIAFNTVMSAFFVFAWNLRSSRLRMSFGSVKEVYSKVGSFSMYALGNSVIAWIAANSDTLLVGKVFGSTALGYYNKAYNLYSYPLNVLTTPITDSLLPFLAELQSDVSELRVRFLKVFRKVSFLSALSVAGMNVCAQEIIIIMYGDAWAPAIPLLSILAFAVYSRGVNGAFSALLCAVGRADLLMRCTMVNVVITLSMIFLGCRLGSVETLSICVAIASNIEMAMPIWYCSRICLEMRPLKFFEHFVPDLFSALLTCAVALLIPWGIENVLFSAIAKASFVCIAMFGLKVLIYKFIYHEHVRSVKDIL